MNKSKSWCATCALIGRGRRKRWAQPRHLTPQPSPVTRFEARLLMAFSAPAATEPRAKARQKAVPLLTASFLALVSDQSLRTTVIAGRPDLGQPDWRNDVPGRVMTPQEVSDVVAWLVARRKPDAGPPYASSDPSQKNN